MKRLLSFLIITGIVVFAGFKAGTWWLADQRLAEARSQLSDYGVLHRGSIGSTLGGKLALKQAAWEDFRLTQPLSVGQLTFDTGSPVALLEFLFNPQNMPATWVLMADGVSLKLESDMFRNWLAPSVAPEAADVPLLALSCGPDARQQPGSGDLLRMGISELAGDLTLTQTADAASLELNAGAVGSVELRWPGAQFNLRQPGALVENVLGSTRESVAVTVRDAGLMRKLSAYCVRETGQALEPWLSRASRVLASGLQARGYEPSDQLLALYRQWLREGGELSFSLRPDSPTLGIPVRTAGADTNESWPVRWNGSAVPEVYLTAVEAAEPVIPPQALEPVAPREDPDTRQWYPGDLASADGWLGQQVRVTLNNGKQVEGRLARVGERELEIVRMIGSGEASYPILKRAIRTFEVWRRGRPD